jgi:hypothetical protein
MARVPIRAGIAGSTPDLSPGPATAYSPAIRGLFEVRQNVPALQNFQPPPLAAYNSA